MISLEVWLCCRFSQSGSWWKREYIKEYVPVITWDTPSVEQFLNGQNYLSGVSHYNDGCDLHHYYGN